MFHEKYQFLICFFLTQRDATKIIIWYENCSFAGDTAQIILYVLSLVI